MRRMGCFGVVFVVLLAVIGYQQWRIYTLESKIASIATKVHAAKGSETAAKNSDLASALAQAQAYTQRAQEFLESKNVVKAQEQLSKAKKKLESANSFSKGIYENSAEFLGKAKVRTEKVFKKALEDISPDSKQKPESEKKQSGSKK